MKPEEIAKRDVLVAATDYLLAKTRENLQRGIKVPPGVIANLLVELDYERREAASLIRDQATRIKELEEQLKIRSPHFTGEADPTEVAG